MNILKMKSAFQKVKLKNFKLKHTHGSFYFIKKSSGLTTIIDIDYTNYSPKYLFQSVGIQINFLEIEKIINPLILDCFNHDLKDNIFSQYSFLSAVTLQLYSLPCH